MRMVPRYPFPTVATYKVGSDVFIIAQDGGKVKGLQLGGKCGRIGKCAGSGKGRTELAERWP